jgi:hypothetical protein
VKLVEHIYFISQMKQRAAARCDNENLRLGFEDFPGNPGVK